MLLKNLTRKFSNEIGELDIKGLAINSKKVKKGFIFFALKGSKLNGENFIREAVKRGAALIVLSKQSRFYSNQILTIRTNKIKELLAEITSRFYKEKPKNIIAVTGTNGKTSVADFFYQVLNNNKIPVASIGTLGIKYNKKVYPIDLTTPDIITLHKNLQIIKKNKIDNVILEASSHGLSQRRLNSLKLKAGIFTNLSQDHLDYHKTMNNYLKSKLILFSKLMLKKGYIISDSSIKQYSILKNIAKKKKLRILDIKQTFNLIKNYPFPLIGEFQMKNLAMAVEAAKICKIKNFNLDRALNNLKTIAGRLELVKNLPNGIKVFIDYAHTPEALSEAIQALKFYFKSDISLVFGCGGERDYKKRPLMAKVAKKFCKKIYVTDDNPRKENPKKIRETLTKNLKNSNYFNIGNRSIAIKTAVNNAEPNEIILVAGKGHENIQDYGNRILHVSDKEIIRKLSLKKKFINKKKQNYILNNTIMREITGGKKEYKINELTLDSRKVKKGSLFVALKGKKNDGNEFIKHSIKKGSNCIVSSRKSPNSKVIYFRNPLIFLNEFAKLKRKKISAKIIAITGSAGKTSLKNLLNNLLEKNGDTYSSPRSFNNRFGVPISISNLTPNNKYGVFEVGMSKPGEIYNLSKIIRPHIGIITNIAEAHIENFKNLKGIAKAKSEIISNIEKNGTIILNRDDQFFNYLCKKARLRNLKIVSFGKSKKSDICLLKIISGKKYEEILVRAGDKKLKFKKKGLNIYNILSSLAVFKELNLDYQKILRIYKYIEPTYGRGKIHKVKRYNKKFTLIDESYNANPFSVKNAIQNLSKIKKKNNSKKYLLIGDMLELGKKSKNYHENLSRLINNSDIDKVFVKGEKTLFTYKNLKKEKRGNIFQHISDIDLILKNIIAKNDYLMIKGSNATGLHKISNSMIKGI